MNLMYEHLRNGAPLPPSQVVRTIPRGGATSPAPAITPANVPPIVQSPAANDRIEFSGRTLHVPD
jgi:hydroxybutyrate-dimer hydrolase